MTRKKVKLAFIINDSARKATYKKRKRGLLKKMDELTTLCDVKACAVLFGPYEGRPVVWPNQSGAREVIASFSRLPEMEKAKKMVSQEEFMRQRVAKAQEQLKKQQKDNRVKDMTHVMYQCLAGKSTQNMSLLDLSDLSWVIDQHLCEINKRVEALKKGNLCINNNITNTNTNLSNNNANYHPTSGLPPYEQAVCPRMDQVQGEGSQGQQEDLDSEQPWSSFMEMIGAPMELDHHQLPSPPPPPPPVHPHPHQNHGMGMGGGGFGSGLTGVATGGASSSTGNNNNMNMMMTANGGASSSTSNYNNMNMVMAGNGGASTSTSTSNYNNMNMMMAANGGASTSTSNNNNMDMMMMDQFGGDQGHAVNPPLWSNFFP